ncbi:MAG TPA: class III lanthionine synthetase LanKC [Longimicrobium sp.]|nr:class III lanthionine synthetase LanKC [Longimicrobium sp.]
MSAYDASSFQLLDPEFYRSIGERSPDTEFVDTVRAVLGPDGWGIHPGGVWTYLQPDGWSGPRQGWKLHVSATPGNAVTVLSQVASVLRTEPAAFKFASDAFMLALLLGKNWPREGGGKFITVYPADEDQFRRLSEALAAATAGQDGPYILSDRRVPGSRVVFYRYGQHVADEEVDAQGNRRQQIRAPSGEAVSDRRRGHYQVPEWVEDPFGAAGVREVDASARKVTLNGRYEVQRVVRYSNTGGIYRARDLESGETVIVREARPNTGWVDGATDAVALLQKEARVLQRMEGTGFAPRLIDTFQRWEHQYLVQENVEGMVLRDHVLKRYFKRRTLASPRRLFWLFRRLLRELVRGVESFHQRGIILRDLSSGNVMVRPDGTLCFIDFEISWERGTEQTVARMHTPGFASPEQMGGGEPTGADDFYALGAMVVELCSFMAAGIGLNPEGVLATAGMMLAEVGLPKDLLTIARRLLDPDPSARWTGDDVRRALERIPTSRIPWRASELGRALRAETWKNGAEVEAEALAACEAVCEFFERSADPASDHRLWPSSPAAYHVNPVCVRFGACGPIEFVRRVRGRCPGAWLDWVERRSDPARTPPGLYVGLAGVGLTLAGCGREEAGRRLLLAATESPLLATDANLYHGAAGVGLAALTLGAALEDEELLDAAIRIGTELEGRAERRRHGIAWRAEGGSIPSGIANGGSGISLFFTYLGALTGEPRWWNVSRRALEFEFAQVKHTAGYAFWPDVGGGRRKTSKSPHVAYGSTGVGAAAVRLYACTGEGELWEWVERCAAVGTLRWTNKLWQDFGYAGWGELFLDMHAVSGEPLQRAHAERTAEILLANRVQTRLGVAFPGGALNRVASDFGMGASGIALYLHRLAHRRSDRVFYPDHLLPGWGHRAAEALPAALAS